MWKQYYNLTPEQTAQVDKMFGVDEKITDILILSAREYRNWFGYFVEPTGDMDGGNVVCRRRKAEIHNWQASSQFD